MVNISKPPRDNFFNTFNTIGKEIQEHKNLFPEVGPIDFSVYKRRTSTINYDIFQVAKDAQLRMEATATTSKEEENDKFSEVTDDLRKQAMQFQSLLVGGDATSATSKRSSGKGVRFAIRFSSESTGSQDGLRNFKEITDHHVGEEEDEEKVRVRTKLFTTLRGARDSLAIIRPKFGIPQPMKFKVINPEPEPIFVVDILVSRLANIYLPYQPPKPTFQEQCDVIVTVKKSMHVQDTERILCHSDILSKSSNAFKEMFDLYAWDMELHEKQDIHFATTTDEGVWRVTNRVIPIYKPCNLHLELDTTPPVIKKELTIHPIDPYCSRHEDFADWIDPKNEDRRAYEAERTSDYDPLEHENPLYEDYCKLVDKEFIVDAEEFIRKKSVSNELSNGDQIASKEEVNAPKNVEPIEGEGALENREFNPFANLPKDMELIERRKLEADALLISCKPFLQNLATSETKETLDDQMLENLEKFVQMADMYFVMTHLEIKKKNVSFEDDVKGDIVTNKLSVVEGEFPRGSFRNSIIQRHSQNKGSIAIDVSESKEIQEGLNDGTLKRNSTTGSIIRVSQIKRPSEVFAELKARRKENLLRKKKSVIKKILYPIEETPLIDPQAHLLEIEQQLDLCLPTPMSWQLPPKIEVKEVSENRTQEGENEATSTIEVGQGGIEGVEGKVKEADETKKEEGVEVVIEEVEEDDEVICKREHHHDALHVNGKKPASKIHRIIKGEWTCATFYAMLEYFYTERCHVPCQDIAPLWAAATEIILQSLTDIIILHPIEEYLRLALKTEANRRALLELATISYKSNITLNMGKLKRFCELFEYGGQDRLPYTFTLYTAFIVDRKIEYVEEGFHELTNLQVCVLKVYDEKTLLFAQNAEGLEFITFEKCLQDQTHIRQYVREQWHGRKVDEPFLNNNREKKWSITVFGPFIANECFKYYEYLIGLTFRIREPETFSLHMPTPFLKLPVLHDAMKKAFPKAKLCVESNRGMSYFIGGETHENSLTITGDPLLILEAIKCIPRDMVGQTSLRFRAPSRKTFIKVFSMTRTIGIDIEKDTLFLLKNMKKLKLALEYLVDLSDTAFIPWDVPREFVELVVPSKPF